MSRSRVLLAAALIPGLVLAVTGLVSPGTSRPGLRSGQASGEDTALPVATGTTQAARLQVHPQIVQPGGTPAAAGRAKAALTAVVKPRTEGRDVVLQRRADGSWSQVAAARADARGRAEFVAPAKRKGTFQRYRVVALPYAGLGKVVSNDVTTATWATPGFTDEFAGDVLGAAWSHRLQGYSPESRRACSRTDPRAVAVGGGTLRLSVRKDPDRNGLLDPGCSAEGGTYRWRINGHVGTETGYSFTYGYAAARVRFQPRRGQHASFWMQPTAAREAAEGSAKRTGSEIDVIEWFGERHPYGGLTSFIYHYPDDGDPDTVTPKKVGGFIKKPSRFGRDWADRYHVFSVEWTPTRYVFRIDGKETFRTTKGVSGQEQYLILSLLSSDYELEFLGGEGRLPQTMHVDWVRVWER